MLELGKNDKEIYILCRDSIINGVVTKWDLQFIFHCLKHRDDWPKFFDAIYNKCENEEFKKYFAEKFGALFVYHYEIERGQ
jgi:hypothetical protein